jgi:[protein-PII] uridylyltransferase
MDRALQALAEDTIAVHDSVALIAVGGYGRGHLSPHSDIDLLILSAGGEADVDRQRLRAFTYAIWDAGWQVGHSLRSPRQAVEFASKDLPTATSILTSRLIAGYLGVFEDFLARRDRWLERRRRSLMTRVIDSTRLRHSDAERAGWALAPDLKEDIGGLRDAHTLGWMEAIAGSSDFGPSLERQSGVLLAAREGLHATLRRKSDKLHIELQPEVARRLGFESGDGTDAMMTDVHASARDIEYTLTLAMEDLSHRILGGPRRSGRSAVIASKIRFEDNMLRFVGDDVDVVTSLKLLAAHAATGNRIERNALRRMALAFEHAETGPWNEDQRTAFFDLLGGRHGPGALELLEHLRGWDVLVPEWSLIRGRPQHDPYHRYTVDGHSFVAIGELTQCLAEPVPANHAQEIGDLSTLYLATLLHDIGKGSGHEHSIEGATIAADVARRVGMDEVEIQEVTDLVRHHLLLPDTATRRDLDDGSVIKTVVAKAQDARRLRQLYLLAIADGRATGPHAWNEWKASLVANLVNRALLAFETGEVPLDRGVAEAARKLDAYEPALAGRSLSVLASLPPSYLASTPVPDMADEIRLLAAGVRPGQLHSRLAVGSEPQQSILTVCVADRPGTLARITGVLALNRIDVLGANAYTTSEGLALARVTIATPSPATAESCLADLEAAFSGHLAVDARMRSKVSDYGTGIDVVPDIRVLHDASTASTVVEVRGPNELGLLYSIAAGLADLDLDIHVAKIDTLGNRVVDVFYVRSQWGSKLSAGQTKEVPRAIRHRVQSLFGEPQGVE